MVCYVTPFPLGRIGGMVSLCATDAELQVRLLYTPTKSQFFAHLVQNCLALKELAQLVERPFYTR